MLDCLVAESLLSTAAVAAATLSSIALARSDNKVDAVFFARGGEVEDLDCGEVDEALALGEP